MCIRDRYELPEKAVVQLEIYSMLGQKVSTLYQSGSAQATGPHALLFESAGKDLTPGMYLLRFTADGYEKMLKLVKE